MRFEIIFIEVKLAIIQYDVVLLGTVCEILIWLLNKFMVSNDPTDVEVAKDCSVAELKRAVEEVFTISPQEGHGMISWYVISGSAYESWRFSHLKLSDTVVHFDLCLQVPCLGSFLLVFSRPEISQ